MKVCKMNGNESFEFSLMKVEDEYLKMNGNERLEFRAQGPGDTIRMRPLAIMSFLEHYEYKSAFCIQVG